MRLFITGTDTEAGKTAISGALAAAAAGWGPVLAAKPVASGVPDGEWGEDATYLGWAAGHPPVCFARYRDPVSPHRAILDGGAPVDPQALSQWIRDLEAPTVIVEGVGGWRVPIQASPRIEVPDLARATGALVVVVARDRLGVLNHARLTVDAVRADGFDVAGLVLNRMPDDSPPSSNLADLALLLDCPVAQTHPFDTADRAAVEAVGMSLWSAFGLRKPPA